MLKKASAYGVLKRGVEFFVSAVSLVLLAPFFAIIAIVIKIDSPGPAFFRQRRIGRDGKEFYILKFRSMAVDNDISDSSCGDRYTRVGKVLRKISVDELPQLVNVLCGEMSFVGPRPWVPEYWENMNERERGRAKVRPGITGLAQVRGRNGLTIFEKIEYDLKYVENYSLRQDIKILFLTVIMVLKQKEVDAGKEGIHGDIDELRERNKQPGLRVILDADLLTSVVVPVGSGARTAREVVNSTLGRGYEEIELLVVNEKMTKGVRKIMNSVVTDGVSVVRASGFNDESDEKGFNVIMENSENVKEANVEMKRGRFLCFIDDTGDLWRPSKIAKQLGVKREEKSVAMPRGYGLADIDAGVLTGDGNS